ncbi:gastrula zinc finger protein XlCGF26.1 isoform X2 [Cimex lectularius]|uniref:Zinc finger protein 865 n=1 Tax=Cimex lectularius TaxID=79782 RepID=A0A8I6R7B8_CIMLE|nr:gastrula zinc finger protein XlCGF26.1 isoform X2 [Cimex lectularius]
MDGMELCRLCALEKDYLLCIYGEEGNRLCIEAKIKKCLNIELADRENLPKSICLECCTKLDAFDEFLDSTLSAQTTLNIIFPEKSKFKNELPISTTNNVIERVMKNHESEEEFDDESEEIPFTIDSSNSDVLLKVQDAQFIVQKQDGNQISNPNSEITPSEESSSYKCETNETSSDPDSDNGKAKDWEPQNWLCSDCSEEFTSVDDLRLHHANEHKQDPRYMCAYCSKLFLVFNGFITHIKRHKNGLKYSCDDCGKGFSNKKVLESHRLTHSDVKPYVCQECGKCFRQQSALYIHSRCHLPDAVKNKYPCDQCNKQFSSKPNLVTHMRIHTGVRNFTCDQCGKSFIQKGNLDAHLLTHSHDKPFSCEVCNKRFKTGMQVRKHHSVHTGAKPHQCDVCGRTFREKGTLREHHRIHSGAMPFTCEFCGKAFRFKGILTTHRRQHTGERPYSCVECQHHFTNWPNYNKHMKRRHGINTSRSARTEKQITPPPPPPPQQIITGTYQDIQTPDLYTNISTQNINQNLPTYMAYNVYSLSQETPLDPTSTIDILPR